MQASTSANEILRIFVGSLSYEVDNHRLKECFKHYGNIKKTLIIRDQRTGQSKGYGFVTFSCRSSFEAAMKNPTYVNSRIADCHPVMTKGALKEQEQRDLINKLFVGGITQATKSEDLRKYFASFGRIREARVLYDGKTGKSRVFGFILFEKPSTIDQIFMIPEHKIKNKTVEIKRFSKELKETCQGSGSADSEHSSFIPQVQTNQKLSKTMTDKQAKPKRTNIGKKWPEEYFRNISSEKERDTKDSGSLTEHKLDSPKINRITEESYHHYSECDHPYEQENYYDARPNFTLSGFYSNVNSQNYQFGGFSSSLRYDSLTYYQDPQESIDHSSMHYPTNINSNNRSASFAWHPTSVQSQGWLRSSIPAASRQF
jgi:RNA recognition motif-containing protein